MTFTRVSADALVADISAALTTAGATTADDLSRISLLGRDADGEVVDSWSLLSCLDGEVVLGETTFLVDAGGYYRISHDYLEQLDEYIDGIHRYPCRIDFAGLARHAPGRHSGPHPSVSTIVGWLREDPRWRRQ